MISMISITKTIIHLMNDESYTQFSNKRNVFYVFFFFFQVVDGELFILHAITLNPEIV